MTLEQRARAVARAVVGDDREGDAGVEMERELRVDHVCLVADEEGHDDPHAGGDTNDDPSGRAKRAQARRALTRASAAGNGPAATPGYPGPGMRSRWPLIAGIVAAGVLAAGIVAVVGLAFGGGGGNSTSKTAYQTTVVNARDRIDYALARIATSQSIPDLVQRINAASDTVESAANDLQQAKVASGFESDNKQLVLTLHAFSSELAGTAGTFSDPAFGGALANANSLSFPEWTKVNVILADMQRRGIAVALLARH